MKLKVVKGSNLPSKFPLGITAIIYLLLKDIIIPEWIEGIIWFVVALLWIASIYLIFFKEEATDIFKK